MLTRSARTVDDLPEWSETVTLDQLIHHTSHIPDFWVELDNEGIGFTDPADQATTVAAIAREPDLEEVEGFSYSNANYVLLAEVVARVSGQALPDFLAARIFTPLGLDMVVAPALRAPDLALSYDDDLQLQEPGWSAYGHTGIITTASQLPAGATSTGRATSSRTTSPSARSTSRPASSTPRASTSRPTATSTTRPVGRLHLRVHRLGGPDDDGRGDVQRPPSNRYGIADALWAIWDPNTTDPGPR